MATAKSSNLGSVLAESAVVTGRITGDGDLEVRGRVEGEITLGGELVIADGAIVRASLSGSRVTIRGAVLGDVVGTEAVVLDATARVVGNLRAPRIAVALGAQIRGELDMGEVPAFASERRAAARPAAAPARNVRPLPTPASRPAAVPQSRPAQVAAVAPSEAPEARKGPPEPVVPAIKKGAKAVAKKKA